MVLLGASTATVFAQCPPQLIGQWGGSVFHVAESRGMLVVGLGASLRLFDVTEPMQPREVGAVGLTWVPEALALDETVAYCYGGRWLDVVDISIPSRPRIIGSTNFGLTSATQMVAVDRFLYLRDEHLVRIIDASDPNAAHEVGQLSYFDDLRSVHTFAGYLYVVAYNSVRVLDLSEPAAPSEVSSLPISRANELSFHDQRALVSTDNGPAVLVSLADPSHPVIERTFAQTGFSSALLSRDRYYAFSALGDYVTAYDTTSTPETFLGRAFGRLGSAPSAFVRNDVVFVGTELRGVFLFDFSVPGPPAQAMIRSGPGYDVEVVGQTAYVGCDDAGLFTLNVSDPLSPQTLGFVDQHCFVLHAAPPLVFQGGGACRIIDVSDPAAPFLRNSITLDPYGSTDSIVSRGSILYIGTSSRGLHTFDITDPDNPVALGQYGTGSTTPGLALHGDLLYQSRPGLGITIIDVSDPANLFRVGLFAPTTEVAPIATTDSHLFGITYGIRLHAAAIDDPINPVLLSTLYLPIGAAIDLQAVGSDVYTAITRELLVVDATDPSSMVIRWSVPIPGAHHRIDVKGRYAYVSSEEHGLLIFRLNCLAADMNCDSTIDNADIDGFVLALIDPQEYAAQFPDCRYDNADLDGNAEIDSADIDLFVAKLLGR